MSTSAPLVAFHATATVHADQESRFVEWKRREGDVQHVAPGFVKRLVLKDLGQPRRYYYMSFWDREDALADLQRNPAFVSLSAEYGVPLYTPSQRDGHAPSESQARIIDQQTAAHPLLAAPIERFRVDVLIDEVGTATASATTESGTEPYAFHYYVHTGATGADAFVAFKRAEAEHQLDEPGFVKRLLLARRDDPGAFVYFSHWVSRAAAHAFHARFVQTPAYLHFYGQLEPYVVAPTFSDCALIDDRQRALGAKV